MKSAPPPRLSLLLPLLTGVVVSSHACKEEVPYAPDYTPVVTVDSEGTGDAYQSELFPLSEGNSWTYVIPGTQVRTYVIQTVSGSQRINEDTATRLRRTDGSLTRDTYLKLDDQGLWDYGTLPFIYASPVPRLLFPVRQGKTWHMTNATTGLAFDAEVIGMEAVSTPAGRFDAVRIRYAIRNTVWGSTLSSDDWWLVPDVGLVKRVGYESSRDEDMAFKFLNENAPWIIQAYDWLLRDYTGQGS